MTNLMNSGIMVDLGAMAEWLCSGLQIRVPRFDSGLRLHHYSSDKALTHCLTKFGP